MIAKRLHYLLPTLIFLFLQLFTVAQVTDSPFQEGSLWNVLTYDITSTPSRDYEDTITTSFLALDDTLINNSVYTKIYTTQDSSFRTDLTNAQYHGGVREEEGRIFFLPFYEQTREGLIFDSSLEIGDTLFYEGIDLFTYGIVQLDSKDSILLNDSTYADQFNFIRIRVDDSEGTSPEMDTSFAFSWIMGVGNTKCPFKSVDECAFRTTPGESLLCYGVDNLTKKYINSVYNDCYIKRIITSIDEKISNTNYVPIIFPNPTQDMIAVGLSQATRERIIVNLFNSIGQNVFKGQLALGEKQIEISLANFSNGLYFLQLTDLKNNTIGVWQINKL